MTEQHTPGPWRWHDGGNLTTAYDQADVDYAGVLLPINRGRGPEMCCADREGVIRAFDIESPDARLIAAAPDLLHELQHIVNLLGPWEDAIDVPGFATLNGARAAIAKATAPNAGFSSLAPGAKKESR